MTARASLAADAAPLLQVSNLAKSYGQGPAVLTDVSLDVDPGELVGVIGPNGSGKTTLFGLLSGQLRPGRGSIRLRGEDVSALGAAARARLGIGRTFQVPQSFGEMTVFENLLVGASFAGGLRPDEASDLAMDIIWKCGFGRRADVKAGALPLLDKKRLELARALATRPRLLLLDEIAGGLTDDESGEIADAIFALKADGTAIIWIEHLVHILTKTASRLVVLGEGRIIADGDPHGTMGVASVRQLYLGVEPDHDALDP